MGRDLIQIAEDTIPPEIGNEVDNFYPFLAPSVEFLQDAAGNEQGYPFRGN